MDAIETSTVERNGHSYRIRIYTDADPPNPLEDWSEMGTILSRGHRHGNFDPVGVEAAIADNPDAVPLSYFEHGSCLWLVAGELPAECQCPWDCVALAGVWLPDAKTLESARNYGGQTRRHFMRKRAHEACDAYTLWCNGEVYGYVVEQVTACEACKSETTTPLDSCWGFFGFDACLNEAEAVVLSTSA